MIDQDHTTFDPRIADWLEGDPNEAPDQALQVVLAAFPSIKQRRAMRLPWRFPRMSPIARAALAALVIALALGGALYVLRPTDQVAAPAVSPSVSAYPSPEVLIPPGVASTRTMEQVIAMAQARNAEMERELGRSLAPFRIIRIQLLRPGRDIHACAISMAPSRPTGAAASVRERLLERRPDLGRRDHRDLRPRYVPRGPTASGPERGIHGSFCRATTTTAANRSSRAGAGWWSSRRSRQQRWKEAARDPSNDDGVSPDLAGGRGLPGGPGHRAVRNLRRHAPPAPRPLPRPPRR